MTKKELVKELEGWEDDTIMEIAVSFTRAFEHDLDLQAIIAGTELEGMIMYLEMAGINNDPEPQGYCSVAAGSMTNADLL